MGALTCLPALTDFAQMVRDGWLGTRRLPLKVALGWVEAMIDTAGVALMVVNFSLQQRGNGSGIKTRV
ncbi:hypothetical protein [Streptomyces sp. NPDC046985]|uniref:hypothetical protein n=1 Tax=Streptomyces sp. NPDC046985 TaxID=3155377 RepID=UPI0033CD14EE